MDERRTRAARARAELALVRFAHELRDVDAFLVVLGGLVPEVLAADGGLIPEHLGTTDVDMLLITHVNPEADLGGVDRALERIEFEPGKTEDGWRWRGVVDGVPHGRTTDIGPRSYAEQALGVEPDGDEHLLRADAVDAVQRFLALLPL